MADAGTFVVEATLALSMATSLSGSVQPLCLLQWLNWRLCKDIGAYPALLREIYQSHRAPTSGGQYHWIAQLAPPSCRTFMSYIMGTDIDATGRREGAMG